MASNEKDNILVKNIYYNLNKPLPDTVPKPNVGCGIRNDECFGLIFAWIVAPEEAMDYDSVEDTVKDVRLSLMENMGLLECKNGLTAKGHKYIYAIRKIQETVQGLPKPEVSYLLNLNVNVIDDDLVSRCGVNTKTFDPSMTVAALECAALQRCSFLLSIKVRTPCTGHEQHPIC